MTSPMKLLVKVGHKPHPINRRKYGAPYVALYWADRRFTRPGMYLWAFSHHFRVLPWYRMRTCE